MSLTRDINYYLLGITAILKHIQNKKEAACEVGHNEKIYLHAEIDALIKIKNKKHILFIYIDTIKMASFKMLFRVPFVKTSY